MRIPGPPSRRRVSVREGMTSVDAPDIAGGFAGLGATANELNRIADEIQANRDRDDLVNAQIEFERARVATDEKYRDDKDLETIHDRRKSDMDANVSRILSGLSERVKKKLEPVFNLEREKDEVQFRGDVRKRDGELRLARASENEDFLINSAVNAKTPEERRKSDALLANHLEAVKPYLKPGEFENLRDRLTDTISYQRAAGMIRANRGRGFNREDYMDMNPAYIDRLEALSESERRKAQADADRRASMINGRKADLLALAAQTGDVGPLRQAEAELRALGHGELANDLRRSADLSAKANNLITGTDGMSFVDRFARLEQEFPIAQVEGAADTARAKEITKDGLVAETKRFVNDPAAYVTPRIDMTLPADAVAEARLEAQRQIGVGLNYKPAILTKDEAANVKRRFDGADADGKLGILREFQAYGRYKGQAMNEAGIPLAAQFGHEIEAADPKARNDARVVVSAATMKPGDLPKSDLKDVDVTIAVNSTDMMETLVSASRLQPHNQALQKMAADAQDAMGLVVRMTGDTKSAQRVMDRNFVSLDEDYAVAIIPRSMVPSESALKDALRRKRRAIGQFLEMDQSTDQMQRGWRVKELEDSGIWVNAPDGDGLVLVDPRDGRAVRGRRGDFYRYRIGEAVPYGEPSGVSSLDQGREYSLTGES